MHKSYSTFLAEYRFTQKYYEDFTKNISWMAAPDPVRAYDIYTQALNVEYGILVMGRTIVDEAGRTPSQFGNAITPEDQKALGVITHSDEAPLILAGKAGNGISKATGGMVMHFFADLTTASQWRKGKAGYHFLYNDAWLLGGAHACADFNLASPRRLDNVWATTRLTATGRELVFLTSHGYNFVRVGKGPSSGRLEVLTVKNDPAAKGATLMSLVASMQNVRAQSDINHLVARGV